MTDAESKEKHGVWDPMPKLTITSPKLHPRVDSQHIYDGQDYAGVDLNPICQSRLYHFGFGLWADSRSGQQPIFGLATGDEATTTF